MSTDFRLQQRVRACDLFDGRLAEFNVREHVHPTQTTKTQRCLTDGRNYLWVYIDDDGFVSSLTRWMPNGDPTEILDAIAVTLDTGIASEYQPQYWGFDTMAELEAALEAAEKKSSIEHKKAEKKFHRELLKYLRGERNNIKPGTVEMYKAEIAKKLVETDPTLLLPTRKDQLRQEIESVYSRDELETLLISSK
jgi:hypothetical protein